MRQKYYQNVKYLQTRTSAEKLELFKYFAKTDRINITNIINAAMDSFINRKLKEIDITDFVKENPKLGAALVEYKRQEKIIINDICGEVAMASGNQELAEDFANFSPSAFDFDSWTPEIIGRYDVALMDTARKVIDEYFSIGYSPTLKELAEKKGTVEYRAKRRYDADAILNELKNL